MPLEGPIIGPKNERRQVDARSLACLHIPRFDCIRRVFAVENTLGLTQQMFAQIKAVVEIATSGFKGLREFKTKRDRDAAVVDMLRFYFLLKDCVDEGEALIVDAGSKPLAKLKALPESEATQTVERWGLALRRQGIRLYQLQGLLYGQPQLAVINPDLEVALNKAIGYKMDRAITLHGIGSALFLRCMFPPDETDKEKVDLIRYMAGERARRAIDLDRIRREVADLRSALEEFRSYVHRLVSDEELVRLSKKAKAPKKEARAVRPNPSLERTSTGKALGPRSG